MTNAPSSSLHVPNRWAWILDVLFGGILVELFNTLELNLPLAWNESVGSAVVVAFVAFSLCVFFLYDVVVYHFLIQAYPYRLSVLSMLRSLLDIVMAFLLMKAVLPAARIHPEEHLVGILVALTAWHLCAAVWHVLANWEHFGKPPSALAVLPHFLFVTAYWAVFVSSWGVARAVPRLEPYGPLLLVGELCAIVLAVSIYRFRQLLARLAGMAAVRPREPVVESRA